MLPTHQHNLLHAVAAMAAAHGTYRFLCDSGEGPFLSHTPIGDVLYRFDKPDDQW